MRQIYEKYYTVRLFSQVDLHFRPEIIEIDGEFDTEEEAHEVGEKQCPSEWWDIQVIPHYKIIR